MANKYLQNLSLDDFLNRGNIAFYGMNFKAVPEFALNKELGETYFFVKKGQKTDIKNKNIKFGHYNSLSEICFHNSDVYFLDRKASKTLLARFPFHSSYVLVNLIPRISWLVAIPGLIIKLLKKRVSIGGIRKFKSENGLESFLVLKNKQIIPRSLKASLSEEIGTRGLFEYLNKEKVKYVVLRFYDKLPNLHRVGGDLDILVADEDFEKLEEFLYQNPGPIGVEAKCVSRLTGNGLPYYIPHLARKIIDSAVEGPTQSRIPSPKEAFLSFAYHVLYHKGFEAGVKSKLPNVEWNKNPENDYAGELTRLSKESGIEVQINMEDLDSYLQQEGWKPKLDTLIKISDLNEWVKKYFFSQKEVEELGLSVIILREGAFKAKAVNDILERIKCYGDFVILKTKKFEEAEKTYIADHLRGGTWNDKLSKGNSHLPSMAIAVLDLYSAKFFKVNTANVDFGLKIKALKEEIRQEFVYDKENISSVIHSTDNTVEALEYLKVCFKDELSEINKEIKKIHDHITISPIDWMWLKFTFYFHMFSRDLKTNLQIWRQKAHDSIVYLLVD